MRSILFEIFGLPIRSYGLMMIVGFLLGLWRATRIAHRRGMDPERVYDLALVVLMAGLVGARLVFILLNPDTESFREFHRVWNGGLSFHGGVAFAVASAFLYARAKRLSFLEHVDLLAPSTAIGYAFTRIGCFLNGCCHGAPTDLPWAVRFHEDGILTPPSHPTQIYAALASLLIFLLLTRLEGARRAPGFVFVSYLGFYAVYRFLIEFLRVGYSAEPWALGLTQAQGVSAAMAIAVGLLIATIYRRPVKNDRERR